jgi:hypothetical protein
MHHAHEPRLHLYSLLSCFRFARCCSPAHNCHQNLIFKKPLATACRLDAAVLPIASALLSRIASQCSMCSLGCGSALCAGLSVVGIVFLTSIGVLYSTQPLFTTPELEDTSQAATQCYIGAGLYAAALLLSLYGMWFDTRRKRRSARAALYDEESIAGQSQNTSW